MEYLNLFLLLTGQSSYCSG